MSAINDAPSEPGWFYWPQDGVWRKEPAMTDDDRPVAEQVREALAWFNTSIANGLTHPEVTLRHGDTLVAAYRALLVENDTLRARWEALKAWAEERYMDKEYRGLFQDKMRSLESGEKEQP